MPQDPIYRLSTFKVVRWPHVVALAFCIFCVFGSVWTFVAKGQRNSIFPSETDRYDIKELAVAPLRQVCPEAFLRPSDDALARCSQSLDQKDSLSALKPLKIQSLSEQAINFHPRFQDILDEQGLTEARQALLQGEPIVLRAEIPRKLFKENVMGSKPNAIVFASAGDSRICYLGACPVATLPSAIPAFKAVLFAPASVVAPQIPIWMFLRTEASPFGLNLQHGLFVTDPAKIYAVERIHIPLINSSELLASVLLLGIAIMALLYAILWVDYVDFVAFAALATFQFLAAVAPVLFMLEKSWGQHPFLKSAVLIGTEINVAVGATFFAMATLRPQKSRFWLLWLACFLTIIGISLCIGSFGISNVMRRWVFFGTAIYSLAVPPLIAFGGGFWMSKVMLQAWFGPGIKPGADARRRLHEQILLGLGLFIAALPVFIRRGINMYGYWTYDISALRSVAMFPLFAILLYAANSKFRTRAESYRKDLVQMARQAATFEMVQMLAHDVRKPFSLLKIGLDLLSKAQTVADTKDIVARLSPQVAKALKGVTGMLSDIMMVSSTPSLRKSLCQVPELIGQCLDELMTANGPMDIDLQYDFQHTHDLDVDQDKIQRVVANLLENAVQAMGGKGRLWFYARDLITGDGLDGESFVKVTVGNSGSFILPQDRERIFDPFFTQGKKGGTGLGLAVAHKFCTLHGGSIQCFSDEARGTEFVMHLPAGAVASKISSRKLPVSCRNDVFLETPLGGTHERSQPESQVIEQLPLDVAATMRQSVSYLKRPLKILIVEDEMLYTAAIQSLSEDVRDVVDCQIRVDSNEALAHALTDPPDLIICDIDLGDPACDGFELCNRLRAAGIQARICVHSNRSLPGDVQKALAVGANVVLPKPMSRHDFILLLADTAKFASASAEKNREKQILSDTSMSRSIVVVIDDDVFIREAWATTLAPAEVKGFASGADFWHWAGENSERLSTQNLLAIIVDWYLQDGEDGLVIAERMKRVFDGESDFTLPRVPIILCTDSYDMVPENGSIDDVIPKQPLSIEQLIAKIREIKSVTQIA
jgi:signal transduction histidine kinase/CheY-like chemotaxis protein